MEHTINTMIDVNEELKSLIKKNIDEETGSDYSTLKDVVLMHNREVLSRRLVKDSPAVLYIREYQMKVTYSNRHSCEFNAEHVNDGFVKENWFCVNLNQPIELKNKKAEMRFNGNMLELVALRQYKTVLPNFQLVESYEPVATLQLDIINKKTNYYSFTKGWKGLQKAGLSDFTSMLKNEGYTYTQNYKDCLSLIQQAMAQNSDFAKAANECNLLKAAGFGLVSMLMIAYEYISNESIKHLLQTETGFYVIETFNNSFKDRIEKIDDIFGKMFKSGESQLEVLGINSVDRNAFEKLLPQESRFYSEWFKYRQHRLSHVL